MRRQLRTAARGACLVVAIGCGDGAEPAAHETAVGPMWTLAPEPTVEIGADLQGDDPLFRIRGVRLLADRSLVVANGGSFEIRRYASNGQLAWTSGRLGEGPGEFQDLGWLGLLSEDQPVIIDRQLHRVTVLSPDGELVHTGQFAMNAFVAGVGVLDDGALLGRLMQPLRAESTARLQRQTAPYVRLTLDGLTLDTLGIIPGFEFFLAGTEQQPVYPLPFGRKPLAAFAGGRLYLTSSDSFHIPVFTTQMVPVDTVVRASAPRVVTKADRAAFLQARRAGASTSAREELDAWYTQAPQHETMPALDTLLTDSQDNLWVSGFRGPADAGPLHWWIFDRTGDRIGGVDVPQQFTVHDVRDDWMAGVFLDKDDVEVVRVYAVQRHKP